MSNGKTNSDLEWYVFDFCRSRKYSYISTNVSFDNFKNGKISRLSFHKADLPSEALRTEIEFFSKKLAEWLIFLEYVETPTARMEIRDILKKPDEPMLELLKIAAKNYQLKS